MHTSMGDPHPHPYTVTVGRICRRERCGRRLIERRYVGWGFGRSGRWRRIRRPRRTRNKPPSTISTQNRQTKTAIYRPVEPADRSSENMPGKTTQLETQLAEHSRLAKPNPNRHRLDAMELTRRKQNLETTRSKRHTSYTNYLNRFDEQMMDIESRRDREIQQLRDAFKHMSE